MCTGKHCDKQCPNDWRNTINRGCGCWETNKFSTSNIKIMHNITIKHRENVIKMKKKSSQRVNSIFIDRTIPPNINVIAFEHTNVGDNLEEAIEKSIELINNNNGSEIFLWYSRGEISDQLLVRLKGQEGTQIDAGKINYNIVTIKPENIDFNDNHTILGSDMYSCRIS